jgi:hypothetical protein
MIIDTLNTIDIEKFGIFRLLEKMIKIKIIIILEM